MISFTDMMRHQLLTIMAVKDSTASSSIFHTMLPFVILSLFDTVSRYVPFFIQWIQTYLWHILQHRRNTLIKRLKKVDGSKEEEERESSILFVRSWGSTSPTNDGKEKEEDDIQNERVDAILDYACSQNTAFHLRYKKRYFMNATDEFKLAPDVVGVMRSISYDPKTSNVAYVEFLVKSTRYNLHYLRQWTEKVYHDYQNKKKNQLGDQRYYFQEIPSFIRRDLDGNIIYESLPKRFCFKMAPFHTFKSLKNVFGEYMEVVRERIELFRDHPEWYEKRGIPYTLGIMLHGTPGCGKTSCIKAIAKDMNRHIFSFSLRDVTTQSQLNNLFFEESVQILTTTGETSYIHIPMDQRIYVIEDIDCMSDVVLSRTLTKKKELEPVPVIASLDSSSDSEVEMPTVVPSSTTRQRQTMIPSQQRMFDFMSAANSGSDSYASAQFTEDNRFQQVHSMLNNSKKQKKGFKQLNGQESENNEKITLSYLLNLIDGVLETPGRILIITTNRPEALDKALIRPGRIDLNIEVRKASVDILHKMFKTYYELSETECVASYMFSEHIHEKWSPAEVLQILGNHYNNPQRAYEILKDRDVALPASSSSSS
jgi:ATPase family associated with various cellular activities (AAA)